MKNEAAYLNDVPEGAPTAAVSQRPRSTGSVLAAQIRQIRSSHAYRTMVDHFRDRCRVQRNEDGTVGAHCWILSCQAPIDYSLKFPHPDSFSADHYIPMKERIALALDPENLRPSHFACNSGRGADEDYGPGALGEPSEIW
ncbi:HNH endonuclease [Mycolicibacterium sphagni]|uniref:HNH endonuclease n=1 Tax=Mycolicibacterium sphagni TaxID=1786 RepID=UPI0021F39B22|nr:HNH endonuclease [Mycolicibacterium sphagni]MCV7174771.1 hypothetical protein [Mycolicibacterium sphagni]